MRTLAVAVLALALAAPLKAQELREGDRVRLRTSPVAEWVEGTLAERSDDALAVQRAERAVEYKIAQLHDVQVWERGSAVVPIVAGAVGGAAVLWGSLEAFGSDRTETERCFGGGLCFTDVEGEEPWLTGSAGTDMALGGAVGGALGFTAWSISSGGWESWRP